jgi:hypothetical protein
MVSSNVPGNGFTTGSGSGGDGVDESLEFIVGHCTDTEYR